VHALKGVFLVESAKEFNDKVFGDVVSVEEDTASVSSVLVVLESTSVESYLFAHASDLLSVEMSEKVELEDTLSYVRSAHQVDFEKLSLEVAFVGSVALKSFEEDSSSLLNSVVLKEDSNDSIKRSLRHTVGISDGDHLSEVDGSSGVRGDNVPEDGNEVGLVVSLLTVR
jgi:hypothetical protein